VTKSWEDNGVSLFDRNPTTGALTFVDGICDFDPHPLGINLPRGMALDPSGPSSSGVGCRLLTHRTVKRQQAARERTPAPRGRA